jgi:hypothetical protein
MQGSSHAFAMKSQSLIDPRPNLESIGCGRDGFELSK